MDRKELYEAIYAEIVKAPPVTIMEVLNRAHSAVMDRLKETAPPTHCEFAEFVIELHAAAVVKFYTAVLKEIIDEFLKEIIDDLCKAGEHGEQDE